MTSTPSRFTLNRYPVLAWVLGPVLATVVPGCGHPKPAPDDGAVTLYDGAGPPPADLSTDRDSGTGGGDMAVATGDMSDPFGGPPVCTSMKMWTGGNHGSQLMHPGRACLECHTTGGAQSFVIAGTVYPTGHEPDDCDGVAGATVEITDAAGKVITLMANSAGNFYRPSFGTSLTLPYHAKVTYMGRERAMSAAQMTGNCNSCHTEAGANGAPGRIVQP